MQQETGLDQLQSFGLFFWDSSVQTFRSFSISLVTFSSVFFLFIYKKKAHVDKEINNRSVKSVGMEMNNLCWGWLTRTRKQKQYSRFEFHWWEGDIISFFFTWLGYSEELQQVQPSKVMMMVTMMMAGPSLLPVRAWTAPHSRSAQPAPRSPQVSDSWPASGMTNTVMSSPEPSFSLGNLQPRSFSTPRDLISRSCAASVYLHDTHKHHLWQSAAFIDPIVKKYEMN